MTADSLKEWRIREDLSMPGAAASIGCSLASIKVWEKGLRPIPRYIPLACAAISAKLEPMK